MKQEKRTPLPASANCEEYKHGALPATTVKVKHKLYPSFKDLNHSYSKSESILLEPVHRYEYNHFKMFL